ncbi:MAG TPA: LuxR C-terminal-related transcriptional regulator [Thermoanaerobaculia bacterium]|nr:LuxR C-terminal-related transcriptional regulator [Thermoanaerobaculia bacterium]
MRSSALRIDDALDLIADAQAAACGMDPRHRIVYWNESATALLGWTSGEVLGKKCYDVFAGRDVFGNICCFRDCGVAVASSRGEAAAPFVMDVRTREGTKARLVTRTIALPSPGAAYRTLVHVFENGDGAVLDALLARVTSVVAPPAEPVFGPPEERITLSPREQQILELLAGGYGSINIAARLGLSHATVRNHVQHLLRRLGVHSQVEAVSLAFRRGMLGRDEAGGDGRSRTDE